MEFLFVSRLAEWVFPQSDFLQTKQVLREATSMHARKEKANNIKHGADEVDVQEDMTDLTLATTYLLYEVPSEFCQS